MDDDQMSVVQRGIGCVGSALFGALVLACSSDPPVIPEVGGNFADGGPSTRTDSATPDSAAPKDAAPEAADECAFWTGPKNCWAVTFTDAVSCRTTEPGTFTADGKACTVKMQTATFATAPTIPWKAGEKISYTRGAIGGGFCFQLDVTVPTPPTSGSTLRAFDISLATKQGMPVRAKLTPDGPKLALDLTCPDGTNYKAADYDALLKKCGVVATIDISFEAMMKTQFIKLAEGSGGSIRTSPMLECVKP